MTLKWKESLFSRKTTFFDQLFKKNCYRLLPILFLHKLKAKLNSDYNQMPIGIVRYLIFFHLETLSGNKLKIERFAVED